MIQPIICTLRMGTSCARPPSSGWRGLGSLVLAGVLVHPAVVLPSHLCCCSPSNPAASSLLRGTVWVSWQLVAGTWRPCVGT